jgi:hypothetical protein
MEERKEEILFDVGGSSHTHVFSISRQRKALGLPPSCGGSHTHVFSISRQRKALGLRPHATLPLENPFVWEPPLQHKLDEIRVLKPEFMIFWAKYSL